MAVIGTNRGAPVARNACQSGRAERTGEANALKG
jgi:hypothetical protein